MAPRADVNDAGAPLVGMAKSSPLEGARERFMHNRVERLPNGHLLVPMRAESDDGIVGDALVEISPEHPDWPAWAPYAVPHDGEPTECR